MDLCTDADWQTVRITRALLVRQPWADLIASGAKRWEIRSRSTNVRGPIAIAAAGTGTIVAVCELVAVRGPLSVQACLEGWRLRGAREPLESALPYPRTFAWVLAGARRLTATVGYHHPGGAVIRVRLDQEAQDRIRRALSMECTAVGGQL